MRTLTTLDELDEKLRECERAARISDDELRRVFQTFRMDLSAQLPPDPFSLEYSSAQMALYQRIAGRGYKTSNEESVFHLESAVARPFPYTGSCQTAGTHLSAIGFLLRTMQLQPNARVLDIGPGWGNTTLALAQLGFEVTALDIEPRFCELIRQRTLRAGVQVEVINDDFFWIETVKARFDAIVTFECFHHCADHMRLLRAVPPALAAGGHIYFGAEPIGGDFPIPWGLRGDGESLWAIRRNGWLELGFQTDYFREALRRTGMVVTEVRSSTDVPWISVWVVTPCLTEPIRIPASDPRLNTQTGTRKNGVIQLCDAATGYALYGPYIQLPKGRYIGRVHLRNVVQPKGRGVIDVCADTGRRILAHAPFDSTALLPRDPCIQIKFDVNQAENDVELRLHCSEGFTGCIERLELEPLIDRHA